MSWEQGNKIKTQLVSLKLSWRVFLVVFDHEGQLIGVSTLLCFYMFSVINVYLGCSVCALCVKQVPQDYAQSAQDGPVVYLANAFSLTLVCEVISYRLVQCKSDKISNKVLEQLTSAYSRTVCMRRLMGKKQPVRKTERNSPWLASLGLLKNRLSAMIVQCGLCALRHASWYPEFNGSHFGLPPSSIHQMTGLGGKMV